MAQIETRTIRNINDEEMDKAVEKILARSTFELRIQIVSIKQELFNAGIVAESHTELAASVSRVLRKKDTPLTTLKLDKGIIKRPDEDGNIIIEQICFMPHPRIS